MRENKLKRSAANASEKTLKRGKKRKIRKWPFIILALILVLLVIVMYCISSYKSGLEVATSKHQAPKLHQFNGVSKNDGKATILILGADREDGGVSRTDSIMIAQYDYIKKDMKIISIMRDIYADIPGYNSYKINAAYSLGGPELLRKTLKSNLGVDVEYYATLDFKGFEAMIDELAPSGIPINVEKDMSEKIGVSLKKGYHRLNGKELLGYARFRNDPEGDFGRVRRQQQVMTALKQELVQPSSIFKAPKLAGIMRGYVSTDMPDSAIYQTGFSFIVRGDKDIKTLSVPVKGSYENITTNDGGSALGIDKAENKKRIQAFLNE
ncbi:LCP family protein [Staphylococcus lutrae]|uniref:Regulatory protein MsrR n=1 Tax=Staphylococcus lutrae TaxID=155085 RepID=A0AAC9WJU9_9STAP|nr:LCP family protein [Staphylococcus lutrae]ARJ51809.1 LytR family transcriptional regulator [Staphylococcus lutrae]PNZ36049.1 LytR family transcriptional regulator [Staphylococcus lutrae]